jgi:siroheme synthase-like protein
MGGDSHSSGSGGGFRTLPINLLLKDRLCLLVGAGHVAHRKLATLLDHGARVVLVAPEIHPGIRDFAAGFPVEIREGTYETALLDEFEPFLVYAATDDDALNRRIVTEATERGQLGSSVSSWRTGDFISPSVLRWGKGQVSITTEGASCRQAKFMRIRLEELLGGDRELLLVGVDLRSLSFSEFEAIRPDPERERELVGMLRHLAALEEFAILATCNRLEVYAYAQRDPTLVKTVLRVMGLESFADRAYVLNGRDVVTHAADVVAGHLSEVVGETQVTAQFKGAFQRAFGEHVAGVHLQNLHDRALRLARRVRAMHGIEREGLPALVAAKVEKGSRVLLLGAGGLGAEVAASVSAISGVALTWANRTVGKIPAEPAAETTSIERGLARLGEFDVAISVVSTGKPIVRVEHLKGVAKPPLLIDLGLPRNIDAAVTRKPDVTVLGLPAFRGADEDRKRLLELTRSVASGGGVTHG